MAKENISWDETLKLSNIPLRFWLLQESQSGLEE